MEEYAQAIAYDQMKGTASCSLGSTLPNSKPRLASLIDRLLGMCSRAQEINAIAGGELDRIVGCRPCGLGETAPSTKPHCAIAELDELVDRLAGHLSSIGGEVERLRGL